MLAMTDLVQILANFGLAVALAVFFVWTGEKRSIRQERRLDAQEKFIREDLAEMHERQNQVIAENTESNRELTNAIRGEK